MPHPNYPLPLHLFGNERPVAGQPQNIKLWKWVIVDGFFTPFSIESGPDRSLFPQCQQFGGRVLAIPAEQIRIPGKEIVVGGQKIGDFVKIKDFRREVIQNRKTIITPIDAQVPLSRGEISAPQCIPKGFLGEDDQLELRIPGIKTVDFFYVVANFNGQGKDEDIGIFGALGVFEMPLK
jgi:hypothetical protein